MEQEKILTDFKRLPPKAQRQAADFIEFLRSRHKTPPARKPQRRGTLAKEAFVGMWQGRRDMKDSRSWLRNIRKSDWGEPSA